MMTIWIPELEGRGESPLYVAIADAIEEDVADGLLSPGARLPTHRRLAEELGVTVGTVTRGYGEAERRGLIVGEVGRGTFVRGGRAEEHGWARRRDDASREVEMSISFPPQVPAERRALAATLRTIADEGGAVSSALLDYQPGTATRAQREAGARWLERVGLGATPERVVVTAGIQHALAVAFSNLLRPGDTLLTAELTYPGARALAQMLGLRLRGVAMDREGILPDALEHAATTDPRPTALYLVPTIQNPVGGVLSPERRRAVAEVAEARDLLVLEDDVHAFLPDEPVEPIASLVPDRTLYLSSMGKALSVGLRTGFVLSPPRYVDRLISGVRSTMWMPPPLMVEVATRWIDGPAADRILQEKRVEISRRQRLLDELLSGHRIDTHPRGLHAWLHLPEPWRSEEFVDQARQRGVLIAGAHAFAVGRREVPHAVRISLTADCPERTREGLETVADLLEAGTEACVSVL